MFFDFWLYPIGLALGETIVSPANLAEKYGPVKEGFLSRTGFSQLRHAASTESVLTLAEKAMASWNVSNLDEIVDALVFVTSTSEFQAPGSASQLQHKLGLRNDLIAIDVNDACTGFLKGLYVALSTLSLGNTGACLLAVADSYSRLYEPSDLKVSPLFSDAATTFIVSGRRLAAPQGVSELHLRVRSTEFHTDGGGAKDLFISRGIGGGEGSAALGALSMNGAGVFNFVLKNLPPMLRKVEASSGISPSTVDTWYVHQGSKTVVDAVASQLGLTGEQLFRAEDYGNVVGSSLPAQFIGTGELDQLPPGSKIGLLAFGVGMTMACVILEKLDVEEWA